MEIVGSFKPKNVSTLFPLYYIIFPNETVITFHDDDKENDDGKDNDDEEFYAYLFHLHASMLNDCFRNITIQNPQFSYGQGVIMGSQVWFD